MKKWTKITGGVAAAALIVIVGVMGIVANQQAMSLIYYSLDERKTYDQTPQQFDLPVEDVTLTTPDGYTLHAWYIPPENSTVIIALHGYQGDRTTMLDEADMFVEHGYGVMLLDMRAHGQSDGDLITFGYFEQVDAQAAYEYVIAQPGVERVAVYGESMGGSTALMFAAENENIEAVVAHTPFASIEDTIETSVTFFTGLPPFPFAPMIQFFAEREYGLSGDLISPIEDVDEIAPRPMLIMVGGADMVVSPEGWLAAEEGQMASVDLWYEPELAHAAFKNEMPDEFERRVIAFYDEHLP